MRLTKYLAAAAAVAIAGTLSWAAGVFQTYPIIGGAAYCASTIGSGPVQAGPTGFGAGAASPGATGLPLCGQTVPAGPATMTGAEVIPADIYTPGTVQIAGGPATALLTPCQLSGGVTKTVVAVAAGSDTMTNNNCIELLVPAGTIASFTVTMPPNPIDGQIYRIASTQTVTALTVSPNTGQTLQLAIPTALTVNATGSQGYAWVFKAAAQGGAPANSWYRIQ